MPRTGFGSAAAAPVLVGLLAVAIGVAGAWIPSIWTDEAATVSAASRSLPELWRLLQRVDAVHGLYYLLMHLWVSVSGEAAWSLRLPSAIAAGAGAAGTVVLGRLITTQRAALIGGLVFSVLPRVTWMGTEARSFAMTAAVAVWLTVVLVRAIRHAGAGNWILYAALGGLAVSLNIYLALLVVAHGITVLTAERRRSGRLRWLAAAAGAAVLGAPAVLLAAAEGGQIGSNRVGPGALVARILVNEFFLGETPTGVHVVQTGLSLWKYASVALAVLGWGLIVVAVVRPARWTPRPRGVLPVGPRALLLPWLLLPTAVIAVAALLGSSLYNPRYFTFCASAAALLIGMGIASLPRRGLQVAALAAVIVLAVPIAASQRTPTAKSGADFAAVAAQVAAERAPRSSVYFAPEPATASATVIRTSRQIAIAYPEDFAGLRDVTVSSEPAADATLWGVDTRLTASSGRLSGLGEMLVIRRLDYPARDTTAEDAFLRRNGFRLTSTWTGTVHEVERWER